MCGYLHSRLFAVTELNMPKKRFSGTSLLGYFNANLYRLFTIQLEYFYSVNFILADHASTVATHRNEIYIGNGKACLYLDESKS